MYVNNIEPEMVLPPGSESFNHNATRTTSSRSRSNNVNNNTVCVYWSRANCVTRGHTRSRAVIDRGRKMSDGTTIFLVCFFTINSAELLKVQAQFTL